MIIFPQAPENNIRVISIFFKFAEIFASQGAPPVSTTQVENLVALSLSSPNRCDACGNFKIQRKKKLGIRFSIKQQNLF
jgi:hypothetical protein